MCETWVEVLQQLLRAVIVLGRCAHARARLASRPDLLFSDIDAILRQLQVALARDVFGLPTLGREDLGADAVVVDERQQPSEPVLQVLRELVVDAALQLLGILLVEARAVI